MCDVARSARPGAVQQLLRVNYQSRYQTMLHSFVLGCTVFVSSAWKEAPPTPSPSARANVFTVCARVVVRVESCRPARRGADLEQVLQTTRTHPGILAVCARQRDRAPNVTHSLAVYARQRLRHLRAPT